MRNREVSRLILHMERYGIDVFEEFGRYNYVKTQAMLPTHTHPDMIEICYLAKGSQEYFVGESVFKYVVEIYSLLFLMKYMVQVKPRKKKEFYTGWF